MQKRPKSRPCKCCDHLEECTEFQFKGSDEAFELRNHFTCDTRNFMQSPAQVVVIITLVGQKESCANFAENAAVPFRIRISNKACMSVYQSDNFFKNT